MKKSLLFLALLPLTACMTTSDPNYYEPVKHRRTTVMVAKEDLQGFGKNYSAWRALDAHAPASWRGATYSFCGYFAAYATKAEAAGVNKITGSSPDDVGRLKSYYLATNALTSSPECLQGTTKAAADGNLMASVNLVRAVGSATPPEVEALGEEAKKQYTLAILNGATSDDMAPLLKDGRFAAVAAARNNYLRVFKSGAATIPAKFD